MKRWQPQPCFNISSPVVVYFLSFLVILFWARTRPQVFQERRSNIVALSYRWSGCDRGVLCLRFSVVWHFRLYRIIYMPWEILYIYIPIYTTFSFIQWSRPLVGYCAIQMIFAPGAKNDCNAYAPKVYSQNFKIFFLNL